MVSQYDIKQKLSSRAKELLLILTLYPSFFWLIWIGFDYLFAYEHYITLIPLRIIGFASVISLYLLLKTNRIKLEIAYLIHYPLYWILIIPMFSIIDENAYSMYFNGLTMVSIIFYTILIDKKSRLIYYNIISVLGLISIHLLGNHNSLKVLFANGGFVYFTIITLMNVIGYYTITSRIKEVIAQLELKIAHSLLEEKNTEIIDSISYAKRIQDAILPPNKYVKELLPNSFILYKPKDIVAGDFYWLETVEDKILFAAADCTGHGVPGAMVSVVCHNALNRAVKEYELSTPNEILNKVRSLVIETFEKSEDDVKDGMDIALCSLNTTKNEIEYSGANNSLFVIKEKDGNETDNDVQNEKYYIKEIKADKQPIGKYAISKPFTNNIIQLNKGDELIIASDGYADQFGGKKGKKLKYKKFKELLLSNYNLPIKEQKNKLNSFFEEWRGNIEQIDDVCVIGVKI